MRVNIADNPILTAEQKSLLRSFSGSDLRFSFYLTGGTALSAFYLSHRLSEDLDFFSEEQIDIEPVLAFLKSVPDVGDIQYERKFDRKMFILRHTSGQVLKVEFTTYPFKRCEEGLAVEEISVDSLKDILVNKTMALTDRKDPKDYVDLFYGFKNRPGMDLRELLRATETKFGIKGVGHIIKGRFLEGLPSLGTLMLMTEFDYETVTRFFKDQALSLISADLEHGS
jgi:predicted nucleotidyltransferase component of viral defense system